MHNNEKRARAHSLWRMAAPVIPIFFWCGWIFALTTPDVALLTLITALCHEFGHLLALCALGKRPAGMRGRWIGLGISLPRGLSYREEAAVYAAGPLANLLLAVVACPLLPLDRGYATLLIALNLVTAASNLLPVEGHDGYGIIRAAVSNAQASLRPLRSVSLIFTALLCLLSLYVVDRIGEGHFLFAVTAASMLSSMRAGLSETKSEF